MTRIKQCACGCNQTPEFDQHYRQRKYMEGHFKGKNHSNWKGGRMRFTIGGYKSNGTYSAL